MTLTMLQQGCLFMQIDIPVFQSGPGRYPLHLFNLVKVAFLLTVPDTGNEARGWTC